MNKYRGKTSVTIISLQLFLHESAKRATGSRAGRAPVRGSSNRHDLTEQHQKPKELSRRLNGVC